MVMVSGDYESHGRKGGFHVICCDTWWWNPPHFQLGDVDSEPHMAKTLGGSTTRCHNRSRGTPPAIILRVSALPSTDIRDDNCMDGGTG